MDRRVDGMEGHVCCCGVAVKIVGCIASFLLLPLLWGCAASTQKVAGHVDTPVDIHAEEGRRIKADPVGYLRELYAKCDALEQYRLTFYRQERLGLVPSLGPMEIMRTSFRKTPFSVKFEWDDEKMPYFESVYVEGQNKNRIVIRGRHGLLVFPPQVRVIDIDLPVKIGKARNPVTHFGLARLVGRTLQPFDDPRLLKVMTIRYEGLTSIEPMNRVVHHLTIERPPTEGYLYTRQDLYVDADTGLPAGTDLWLKDGNLDARYRYADIDQNVHFTDVEFRLAKDHPLPETIR